ncbi:p48 polypeptide of DNA primase [Ophidiomyces ophidiicola]|nr:p48 polypeptide of DNA primase [Ophidiomyces ophidiicola]KAI2002702.1 p48 polypeptide of DNA primase [Ophidiomyces ophidiicola]KAI2127845.1 p48 polypeptide of DNA primase [Ophidiomyces ophidiicola]KAI2129745.1 p48 polypeptide of DNA primase [Ophidiomyces ophidiicola]KAI2208160.1 p48 polypeptide of DNA primase [Ophidiomyces ophidiicola]
MSEGNIPPNATSDALPKLAKDTTQAENETAAETNGANLEDILFNDDDDDDEYPFSSAADANAQSSQPENTQYGLLPSFAKWCADRDRLFPFKYLYQWLNHGVKPSVDFGNREFAFTLQNDAYLRYQSFPAAEGLRKEIIRLNPSRFEIGPVYSTNPRDRKSLPKSSAFNFKPVSKELVFDIDLTDYDDIRTCCEKANICPKCWAFVTMAIKVIDSALREDFAFEHILWVYSGRRGAHAWVCDQSARDLPDDRRKAIAGYLELVRGGSQSGKRVNLKRPLHPHINRSLDILRPYFSSTILNDQDTFASLDQTTRLLQLIPDKSLKNSLQKKWESALSRDSTLKWSDIDAVAKTSGSRGLDTKALLEAKQDIVLEYTYPRLDAEVSKKLIHLLKSPFVVHPGTGRVCVPIDIGKVDQFNPLDVPTVSELLDEINAWDLNHAPEPETAGQNSPPAADGENGNHCTNAIDRDNKHKKLHDYEKTRLKPFIDYFRKFVANLNRDERVSSKRERDEDGIDDMGF